VTNVQCPKDVQTLGQGREPGVERLAVLGESSFGAGPRRIDPLFAILATEDRARSEVAGEAWAFTITKRAMANVTKCHHKMHFW
jgi:hypothetical protein